MTNQWAIFFLIAVATISLLFGLTLPDTKFDYNFEKFFKPADEATKYFNQHRDEFGTDNDFVLLGIESEAGVFDPEFLDRVEALTSDLKDVSHVTRVISPTNSTLPVRAPLTGAIFNKPLLSGNRKADSIAVFSDPSLVNNLFSKTKPAISIVIETKEKLSKSACDELAKELENTLDQYPFENVYLSGRAIGQVVYIEKIQGEFTLFMLMSIGFVLVLLFLMFRSFRGIIIPLATVLLSVLWSIGILNLSGRGVGILLNMLPPVIFVVGMSDAVHLYSRFLEELKKGNSKEYAIRQMVYDTGLATLLTSITTAIGFASLYFTGIPALQEFGLLTAAGVLAAFVIAITMLPAWLVLSKEPERTLKIVKNSVWSTVLERAFVPIVRKRKAIFVATPFLVVLLILGGSKIELNNFLLEDLKPGEPLRQSFTYFDKNFSGVRPFEVGIQSEKGESLINRESIEDIQTIQEFIKTDYEASALASVAEVSKELNRSRNAGRNNYYKLPEGEKDWSNIENDLRRIKKAGKLSPLINDVGNYTRISGRVGDWGAQEFRQKNQAFNAFLKEKGFSEKYDISITGTGTLIDKTNQNLVYSLGKGLGSAFLLIAVLMGFMFKSLRMIALALIPNVLPLLALTAVMGVLDIDLKMSTSIIFTIAFGIAVDDTIHLLSRYKLELRKGKRKLIALKNAYTHTGKALILTSIILLGGFFSLCFSSFQSTYYIGLLVCVTLIIALFLDLTLFPALLASADNPGVKKEASYRKTEPLQTKA